MGAIRSCLPVYRALMAHTPGHVVLVVGAVLASQLGLLLTLWLPWKLVVMLAGAYLVLHGELSEGGFISFLLLVGVFFRPVEKINAVLETYPKGIAGFKRYVELQYATVDEGDRVGHRRASHSSNAPPEHPPASPLPAAFSQHSCLI